MMNNKSTWTTAVFAVMTMLAVTCTVGSAFVVTTPTANKPTGTTSTQVFSELAMGKPGTADIPCAWEDLGFEFRPTKSHVRMTFKDGEWSEPELVTVSSCCSCMLLLSLSSSAYGRAQRRRTWRPLQCAYTCRDDGA